MHMNEDNCFIISKFPNIYLWYGYFDTDDYLADSLFRRFRIPVRFYQEYKHPTNKYRIIICRISRKYEQKFLEAMRELVNKMNLLGNMDYEEFCSEFITTGKIYQEKERGASEHEHESLPQLARSRIV